MLLDLLKICYRKFSDNNIYDTIVSDLVINLFEEHKLLSDNIESELTDFVNTRSDDLTALFNRYEYDSHGPYFLKQPEIILILYQLEKDPFVLHEYWLGILPERELIKLADEWAVPMMPKEL